MKTIRGIRRGPQQQGKFMDIGVPKESKTLEFRVGLIPQLVTQLVEAGHRVTVEHGCGDGAGFADQDYDRAGARIVDSAAEVFAAAELIVKVKEPQPFEIAMIRPGQFLFTYLHLAANAQLTDQLLASDCIAIAYETVTGDDGRLPLLTPMSQIAGRIAVQAGAHFLEKGASCGKDNGNGMAGRGVLLSGLDGVPPGNVVILGGGNVGANAARIAIGMGAAVTIFDASTARIDQLRQQFGSSARCLIVDQYEVEKAVVAADLVIGSVLIPGASAPRVVSAEVVQRMATGAVLVDVAIDQGGCFETSRPTTLDNPVYAEHGVIHYCVTNMPSAVARSATLALNHITGPAVLALASAGIEKALQANVHLQHGVNIFRGRVTHQAVADSLQLPFTPLCELIGC